MCITTTASRINCSLCLIIIIIISDIAERWIFWFYKINNETNEKKKELFLSFNEWMNKWYGWLIALDGWLIIWHPLIYITLIRFRYVVFDIEQVKQFVYWRATISYNITTTKKQPSSISFKALWDYKRLTQKLCHRLNILTLYGRASIKKKYVVS